MACAPGQIALSFINALAYTFHYADLYALRNNGTSACTLDGYPTVTVYHPTSGALGAPVGVAARHASTPPFGAAATAVTVPAGDSGGVVIGYVADPDRAPCLTPTTLRVLLPGMSASIDVPRVTFDVCAEPIGGLYV